MLRYNTKFLQTDVKSVFRKLCKKKLQFVKLPLHLEFVFYVKEANTKTWQLCAQIVVGWSVQSTRQTA